MNSAAGLPLDPAEVYRLLHELHSKLLDRPDLRASIERALQHFVPPVTSEFLGEAMAALEKVGEDGHGLVSDEERAALLLLAADIKLLWFSGIPTP